MAYNTGNPIGSLDPRDAADNKQNFDRFALSTERTYTDRLGVERKTVTGTLQDYAAYNFRGPWATATAYNVNDVWRDGAAGAFYLVLADYTSGASAAADISGGNVVVHQPKDWVVSVATISDLRNLEPAFDMQEVSVSDKYGFSCVSDFSDTTSGDDGKDTFVTPSGKRWKRRIENIASYEDFNTANPHRSASAEQLNNMPSLSPILNIGDPMVLQVVESDVNNNGLINLFARGASGKLTRHQIITGRPSGGNSLLDDTCPVWRQGKIVRCEHIATYKSTPTVVSGTWSDIALDKPSWIVGITNPTQQSFAMKSAISAGAFIEFETSEDDINLLFVISSASVTDALVEFIFGGVTIFSDTISLFASDLNIVIKSFKNPVIGETVTVRITKGSSGTYMYVGGINASFDDIKYKDVDTIAYMIDADKEAISNGEGATNYAMTCVNGVNALLFGGESHGGETIIGQKVSLDGVDITPVNGGVHVGRVLKIDRSSIIEWDANNTVSVDASLLWTTYGVEFNGSFSCSDDFKAGVWYSPMLVINRNTFNKMTYPELVLSSDIPPSESRDVMQSSAVSFESTDNVRADMVWTMSHQQAFDASPFWSPDASVFLSNSKYYYNIVRNSSVRPFSQKVVRVYR